MSTAAPSTLTPAEVGRLVRRADPAALLLPPRILRRVIKMDKGLTGLGLQVPHRKSYVIGREDLLRMVSRSELGVPDDHALPATLLLFPSPESAALRTEAAGTVLLQYWRYLFHARIHQEIQGLRGRGVWTPQSVRAQIERLGPVAFDEVRQVLGQEHFLLTPDDPTSVFEEFVAVFLDLRYFAPDLVPRYFPALEPCGKVHEMLAGALDADRLFAATRLEGAPAPPAGADPEAEDDGDSTGPLSPGARGPGDPGRYQRLMEQADRAGGRGNVVRAALLRTRARALAPAGEGENARGAALAELDRLTGRLQRALDFPVGERPHWRQALACLLEPAAAGIWPVEARLLYDLQKVCLDHEREVFAVDLVEWVVSWGEKPIQRRLPHQREILMVKHLGSALQRLAGARLPAPERRRLEGLLQEALHQNEERLRELFRPLVRRALDQVDLVPARFAEAVSRDTLTEELLDRVVERRFLTIGDLRDAIARNRLKLPDLSGAREFFRGDRLIRANRRLAFTLDGVYHRGEIYLRWLQRFSSLGFGTRVGRFLTRYLVLPFGGAFLVLEFVHAMLHEFFGYDERPGHVALAGLREFVPELPGPHQPSIVTSGIVNVCSVGLLGLFFLGLLHLPAFRNGVARGLVLAWRGFRAVFLDVPRFVLGLPFVRYVLQSRLYLFLYQFVFKPLVPTLAVDLSLYLRGASPAVRLGGATATFLAVSLLLNSSFGHRFEEYFADWLARTGKLLWHDLLPGLVRAVAWFFKSLLDEIERLLYTVDEWLRFRTGDSRASLYVKLVLGLVWFGIAYVVRFGVNLLLEPQLNPIKHFPVVTVSHKVLLPLLVPPLAHLLALTLDPALAGTVAFGVVALIPGIFGFLVWELKENWRLYGANQPATLGPAIVGHHGETFPRLLRPGFHSGTVPKIYARWRRSQGRAARKQLEALHQLRETLHHFVERDLLDVLAGSRRWGRSGNLSVGAVALGCNRIRLALCYPDPAGEPLHLDFEEHEGTLVAGPSAAALPGWLGRLVPDQRQALEDVLAGFYKLAGVDAARLPVSDGVECLARVPEIPWQDWVEGWERDRSGKAHGTLLGEQMRLLPRC